jgi:hypothetical protein
LAGRPETDCQTEYDISRRNALISIGKYAAYVTPAMTVLIRGNTALANHACNGGDDGNGNAHSCM